MLPADRPFVIPEWLAWPTNLLSLAYIILTSVLFLFPPDLPVTGSNMNYAIAAFGIVLLISTLTWIFDGRKNFVGPKVEIDHQVLSAAEVPQGLYHSNRVASGEFPVEEKRDETVK